MALPPAATATYCRPSSSYVTGGAFTPAPQLNCQSRAPVRVWKALKSPLPSPTNTRSPAVASTPPTSGCAVVTCQAIFPRARVSMALSVPHVRPPEQVVLGHEGLGPVQEPAVAAVEDVEPAGFARLPDGGNAPTVDLGVEEHRRARHVVAPHVVRHLLVVPGKLARVDVHGDDRHRVEVVAGPGEVVHLR